MKAGRYIVIEGQDGTGKTTQADLLAAYLHSRGIDTIHIKEPGGSPVAEAIRGVILDATLPRTPMTNTLLFTANRHELWHAVIQPALKRGTWVICTRNYWSTLAFQGYGEGMDLSIISAITATFTDKQYMSPDFSVVLAFDDIAARQKRIASRGKLAKPDTFESKTTDFQTRVQGGYRQIAKEFEIPLLDASRSIEAIHSDIVGRLEKSQLLASS